MSTDILEAVASMPSYEIPPLETVYIIGTGPNGAEHYERVPHDAIVIGVNKAIILHGSEREFYPLPMWLWLCGDTGLPEHEWFREQADLVIKCGFSLKNHLNPTACFGKSPDVKNSIHGKYPGVPYTFKHGVHLKKAPSCQVMPYALRGGASIGAQAVQLAYLIGAQRIVLCGIDMKGDVYFDGTVNKVKHMFENGRSRHLPLFNGLCKWIIDSGREVVSLSETALDIPRI